MFLSGTKLITTIGKEQIPIISLDSINLEELPVKYPSYQLQGANLEWAWLSYADLSSSDLSYANLTQAEIINANLDRADLRGAIFESANLKDSCFVF